MEIKLKVGDKFTLIRPKEGETDGHIWRPIMNEYLGEISIVTGVQGGYILSGKMRFHPDWCVKVEGRPEQDQLAKACIFEHRPTNMEGQILTHGKIAMGRLVDERQYQEIEHYFTQERGRKPTDIEMYEECLRYEKELLTQSILLKVPELIKFRAVQQIPREVTVFAELDVLIPESRLAPGGDRGGD
jgi:hypothetical protein